MNDITFREYLRKLRKSSNYTQEYVASQLDVSRQAYSHYETGRATPTNDTCYKIAKLYSIQANTIIGLSMQNFEDSNQYLTQQKDEDLLDFFKFLEDEKNANKLKDLTRREKELIYYFHQLSLKDQDEILEFMKLKIKLNSKK